MAKKSDSTGAEYLSKSAFAARHGWHRSNVSHLISQGRLVLSDDGKRIHVAASEKLLEETGFVDKYQSPRRPGARSAAARRGRGDLSAYNRARTEREQALAAKATMELHKLRGTLVEVHEVRAAASRLSDLIVRGFENIPDRIGVTWSRESDPDRRARMLNAELDRIRTEFADAIGQLFRAPENAEASGAKGGHEAPAA